MALRMPFFGLLAKSTPMDGLVEHYDKIRECLKLINESLECYVTGGSCRELEELSIALDKVEAQADKIKRGIRNHLPRNVFMAVEKPLFFNYTSKQDNVLDSAQDALHWLAIRNLKVPEEFQKDLIYLMDGVSETATLLGPALKATIGLVRGTVYDREGVKRAQRQVRHQRDRVRKRTNDLTRRIFNSDLEFKDIYQLIHFVECLCDMSNNAASCSDILRAMIAR